MEQLITNLGKKFSLNANPSYYDYIHSIKLFFDTDKSGSFELIDGGGQTITGNYKGDFTIENTNIINFIFKQKINIYYNTVTSMYLVKQIEFKIKEEECEHFNGYCKYISEYTVQLNCSPFNFDELKNDRNISLYNMLNNNDFPLTFYTGLNIVPCDVIYEREKRDN
jgi:hypothetical protein